MASTSQTAVQTASALLYLNVLHASLWLCDDTRYVHMLQFALCPICPSVRPSVGLPICLLV